MDNSGREQREHILVLTAAFGFKGQNYNIQMWMWKSGESTTLYSLIYQDSPKNTILEKQGKCVLQGSRIAQKGKSCTRLTPDDGHATE